MARLPKYSRSIRDFNREVDAYIKRRHGNRRCSKLRTDIARGLATTLYTAKACRKCVPSGRLTRLLGGLEKQIAVDNHKLPRAWYEKCIYGTSKVTAAARWKLHKGEFRAMEQVWRDAGFSISEYKNLIRESDPRWRYAVDELHEDVTIRVLERSIADMLLLALEAYAVPKGRGTTFTEVYGICFGSMRPNEERRRGHGKHTSRYAHVRSVRTQVRARGFADRVDYDTRSVDAQIALMDYFMLGTEIVADFHTHPYETDKDLIKVKGWEFSEADEKAMAEWVTQLKKKKYLPRASIIMAVAKGKRRMRSPGQIKPNVVRFSIGKYHFYLAAYRICGDRYTDRGISLNAEALPGI